MKNLFTMKCSLCDQEVSEDDIQEMTIEATNKEGKDRNVNVCLCNDCAELLFSEKEGTLFDYSNDPDFVIDDNGKISYIGGAFDTFLKGILGA
jgi:uncharacterized protein YlaI